MPKKTNKIEKPKEEQTKTCLETKPIERISLITSLFAIFISLTTAYLQFFYEKHNILVSVIDIDFPNDTILKTNIIFQNKSNLDETILGTNVIFYQDSTDEKRIINHGIRFSKKSIQTTFSGEFSPLVLTSGQQHYKELNQPFSFKNLDPYIYVFNRTKKVFIGIEIDYINDVGAHSNNLIPIGWIKLDTNYLVKSFEMKYTTKYLESQEYYSGKWKKE